MPEPFEYNITITTMLRKLAKKFPNISFCLRVETWYWGHTKEIGDIAYIFYCDPPRKSIEAKSLEEGYNLMLELLKKGEIVDDN